jgi:hypothetical protein
LFGTFPSCLGQGNIGNSPGPILNVPRSGGANQLDPIGGIRPMPVPRVLGGSTAEAIRLGWDAASIAGVGGAVTYDLYGVRKESSGGACPAVLETDLTNLIGNFATTAATVAASAVPGTGSCVTFGLKLHYPDAGGGVQMTSRFVSANGTTFVTDVADAQIYAVVARHLRANSVEVSWRTSLEDNVHGFYVSRGDSADGPFSRVSGLIPAKGEPSSYSYIDTVRMPSGPTNASGLFYKIESIDLQDHVTYFGPVRAQLPRVVEGSVVPTNSTRRNRR